MKKLLSFLLLLPLFCSAQPAIQDTGRYENGHVYWTGEQIKPGLSKWTYYYENGQKMLVEISDSLFTVKKKTDAWLANGTQTLKDGNGYYVDRDYDSTVYFVRDSLYNGPAVTYRFYWGDRRNYSRASWKKAAKGDYHAGKKEGEWYYYDDRGYVAAEVYYKNGVANGPATFYYKYTRYKKESGNLDSCTRVGEWNEYDSTGIFSGEFQYENGQKSGPCTLYYPDGKVKAKGQYRQISRTWKEACEDPEHPGDFSRIKCKFHDENVPAKCGRWIFYDENGKVIRRKKFRDVPEAKAACPLPA